MSLGWSSFVTGFAKQATTLIQERDKEIQELINERLEKMNQDAKEARKLGASRKEELASVSNSLVALGLPENEVASLIESQGIERAKQTAELLQKEELTGGLTPDKVQRMTAGLPKTDTSLQGTIERLSTPTTGAVAPVQMERAFGLGGGRRAAEFEERAGMLPTELPEMPRATGVGGVDLSVFAEEPTLTEQKQNYISVLISDESTEEEKMAATTALRKIAEAEDIGKDKDKDLKESDVRATLRILDSSIKQSIAGPGDLVVYTNPETGEKSLELSNDIDPKVRIQIQRERKKQFDAYVNEHYARSGQVPSVVTRVVSAFLGPQLNQMPSAEELRADANAKIAENPAVAQEVRAEFKKLTGQDL
jgi:hypothetical protein